MEDRPVSNMTFRVMLLGISDIVGENGLRTLLRRTSLEKYRDNLPPSNENLEDCMVSEATRLDCAIEDIYGEKGAISILRQVGNMQAVWGIEENQAVAEALKQQFAGKSDIERATDILTITAAIISAQMDTTAWVEMENGALYYRDRSYVHCFDRTSGHPVCYVTEGFLMGLARWAAPNVRWRASEETCMAAGGDCCSFAVMCDDEGH
ncbi:MAG: 4-vinyl reductase [Deltaproteobacteria bacterium]|nr:4-vinyl reductase [Candidatus Zymogenaceae bacterium]